MVAPAPSGEVDTADHAHVSVVVSDPRRRSLAKLLVFELDRNNDVRTSEANNTVNTIRVTKM